MGRHSVLILFIIGLIGVHLTNAFVTLIPQNKQIIYDYEAHIRAGTPLVMPHASSLKLHGKLHLQTNGNVSVLWLSDLVYKMYNGVLDHNHEHQVHEVPIPNEIQDLQKPFRVMYDTDGKVIGIATETKKQYVRNMQKAIANIFQMDVQHVTSVHVPHGFVTEEPSIYGFGQVNYNVMPKGMKTIVEKVHEMHSSHHIYEHVIQNVNPLQCETQAEPIVHDSQRRYVLVKNEGDAHHMVKHIEATGGYYYFPLQSKSDTQYLFVNQTFNFSSVVDTIATTYDMPATDHNLKFVLITDEDSETLPWKQGPGNFDMTKMQSDVVEMLEQIKQYLHAGHIHDKVPNDANAALILRVHRALTRFSTQDFEHLHGTLSQKTDQEIPTIFYEMLPMVGTKASSMFIRNLVLNKKVKNEALVEILENYARHVKNPTEKLVHDMEFLVQLPETMDWNVRKVAILAFGGLVHKAHEHHHHFAEHMHHHDHDYHHIGHGDEDEKPVFEKYLLSLLEKAKSTQKSMEQVVYFKAIANMRLPQTVKHLIPVVEGEWSHDHNLRLHAMWAMHSVLDETTAYEVMWPLLANHDEHTEIRILAYYIIMTKHPSLSRIANIYWLLQHEPNQEVYHFHYTFVQNIMESVEPCREEFANYLKKFFRYMQPASHGVSRYQVMEFKDPMYEFSGGMTLILVNSNTTKSFTFMRTSQIFHQYYNEEVVQVRVHGLNNIALDSIDSDQILNFFKDLQTTKGVQLEVVVVRHGMVENVYHIDENSHDDLKYISSFFTSGDVHTTKNHIHITFDKYIQIFLPTDLGVLGLWQLIVPSVEKLEIDMKKEVKKTPENAMLNLNVDTKYISWVHAQNGFVFYNPVVDVWHGAWRSQSYNVEVPIFFDVMWNQNKNSLKFSWRRHNDVQKDVGGIRTHVTQYVFVWDEHQRNLLKSSCHECAEWVPVEIGEDYKKHYDLMEVDDVNTGTHWKMSVFDTEQHITNGSYRHIAHLFVQPHTKSFSSPLGHWLMTFMNWHHYVQIWPEPSNLGFLLKVTPSNQQSISSVDLNIKWTQETTNIRPVTAPGMKLSTKVAFAVKNKEQSLRKWDLDASVEMDPGHKVNKLKMHVTRVIPNQKNYEMAIEGIKKYRHNEVTGHLTMEMGQTSEGKWITNETQIDISMTGKPSHAQTDEKHVYGKCNYAIPYSVHPYHTMQCIVDHTTIRKYVYNVKTEHVPSEFRKIFWRFVDYMKAYHHPYYTYSDEHEENLGEHDFKVEVEYPVQGHEVDVKIVTPQNAFYLASLPTKHLEIGGLGMAPDSTVFSIMYQMLHTTGELDHCNVHLDDRLQINDYSLHHTTHDEWSVYVGDSKENPKTGVYVKKFDGQLDMKVVDERHTLEMIPKGNHFQMKLDGKIVSDESKHEDWIFWDIIKSIHEDIPTVVVFLPNSGILMEYQGHNVNIVIPKVSHGWQGHCYSHY